MGKKLFSFSLLTLVVALALSGCSISLGGSSNQAANDGAVYKSANKGDSWQQKALIPTVTSRPLSIATLSGESLEFDPSDNKAIYYGSVDNGLFYSYDGADNWQLAKTLGKGTIKTVAVDPNSKCIIYAAIANKLYKSNDCNRTWNQVYYDNDTSVKVNSIVIDHFDSLRVYIATSRGEVIKSYDGGNSWQTIARLENAISKIVMCPVDSRIIFAGTASKGLFRTKDSGANWENLEEKLKEFSDTNKSRDIVISKSEPGTIILATTYGLLKSIDYGDKWSNIELITPEKKSTINTVAVNPKNAKEIYYATNTTFYSTIDGGENWSTKKLPSTRIGWKIIVDPVDDKTIYLAVKQIKQ